jgi:hypothetical protein
MMGMPMVVHNWINKIVFVKGGHDEENDYVGNGFSDAAGVYRRVFRIVGQRWQGW